MAKHLLILGPKCPMHFSAELSETLGTGAEVCIGDWENMLNFCPTNKSAAISLSLTTTWSDYFRFCTECTQGRPARSHSPLFNNNYGVKSAMIWL